jgi:hypothetical protein
LTSSWSSGESTSRGVDVEEEPCDGREGDEDGMTSGEDEVMVVLRARGCGKPRRGTRASEGRIQRYVSSCS